MQKFRLKVTFDEYGLDGRRVDENAQQQTVKVKAESLDDAVNRVHKMSFGNRVIVFVRE